MTALYISYPDIPFRALERAQSVTFDSTRPIGNTISGERYQYASATAGASGAIDCEWDLGFGNTSAVDHIIIANAYKTIQQGSTSIALDTSSTGIGGSYTNVWTDAGFSTATLRGPDSLDYIQAGNLENLIYWSEAFQTAPWVQGRSSITPNAIAAPDGTTTADKLLDNGVSGTHRVYQIYTMSINVSHTVSVYVKAAEFTKIRLALTNQVETARGTADFDLSAGTVSNIAAESTSIENAGNGWWRCSVTDSLNSGDTGGAIFIYTHNGSGVSYTGTGTDGVYIWGAQVRRATTETTYVKTEAGLWQNLALQGTAARTWKWKLSGGSATTRELNKIYFGSSWNPGKDPDDYSLTLRKASGGQIKLEDGADKMIRLADAKYFFTVTWDGVSDANAITFTNKIKRYWQKSNFFLYTTENHRILNNMRLLHVRLLDEPTVTRGSYLVGNTRYGRNTITCNFAEVRG